jgi:hypothetical protein
MEEMEKLSKEVTAQAVYMYVLEENYSFFFCTVLLEK